MWLGLSEDQIQTMEPGMLLRAIRLAKKREAERIEETWKRERWQTAVVVNMFSKRTIKPEKLLPLPSDQRNRKELPTLKDWEEFKQRHG